MIHQLLLVAAGPIGFQTPDPTILGAVVLVLEATACSTAGTAGRRQQTTSRIWMHSVDPQKASRRPICAFQAMTCSRAGMDRIERVLARVLVRVLARVLARVLVRVLARVLMRVLARVLVRVLGEAACPQEKEEEEEAQEEMEQDRARW